MLAVHSKMMRSLVLPLAVGLFGLSRVWWFRRDAPAMPWSVARREPELTLEEYNARRRRARLVVAALSVLLVAASVADLALR